MATHDIHAQGDKPYHKDIDFVEMKLAGHERVTAFARVGTSAQLFSVTRDRGDTILVWLSDVYTLGQAEYLYMRQQTPGIRCIVSVSGYTRYTDDAKEQAVRDKVGLFKIGEFLGALNVEQFWAYVAPKKNRSGALSAARAGARRKRGDG